MHGLSKTASEKSYKQSTLSSVPLILRDGNLEKVIYTHELDKALE